MSENGKLLPSELSPIAGGGYLAHEPAAAWNAFAAFIYEKYGVRIAVTGPDSAYRPIDRQWYYWNLYQSGQGNLAAYPGTSNHGLGINVDVPSYVRSYIDAHGAQFGWSKSWSDAPSEWWHITYQSGHYTGSDPGPGYSGPGDRDHYPVLKIRSKRKAAVKRAQKHLRRWNLGVTRPEADGSFGKITKQAVIDFQRIHHMEADGIIGKKTWAALRRRDHFLDDERATINRLVLATSNGVQKDEEAAVTRYRDFCSKRAAAIRHASMKRDNWSGHNRRERFSRLHELAIPGGHK